MSYLQAIDIQKNYFFRNIILDNINMEIKEYSIHGLIGLNASGKTTLMNIFTRNINPSKGDILFNGRKIRKEDYSYFSYAPQDYFFPEYLNSYQFLSYMSIIKNIKDKHKEIKRIIDNFKLEKDKKICFFSFGQKKILSIAQAFLGNPKVIFLDEPFSGIDCINKEFLKKIILVNQNKSTIILNEHKFEDVENFCTHISILHEKKIILTGNLKEILDYKNTYCVFSKYPKKIYNYFINNKEVKDIIIDGNVLFITLNKNKKINLDKFSKDIISIKRGFNLEYIFRKNIV
jgi:ABC-2 type transport system ATP-binding protein